MICVGNIVLSWLKVGPVDLAGVAGNNEALLEICRAAAAAPQPT